MNGHDCRAAGHKLSSFRLEMGKVIVIVVIVGEMRPLTVLDRHGGQQGQARHQSRLAGEVEPRAIFAPNATVVAKRRSLPRFGTRLSAAGQQA